MKYIIAIIIVLFSPLAMAVPSFIDVPTGTQKVTEANQYVYDVNATGEGTNTFYDLIFPGSSNYFTIDSSNGIINYLPGTEEPFTVIIIAIDLSDFSLTSTAVNFIVDRKPQFTNLEDKITLNNSDFNYLITTTDLDGDSLIFSSDNMLLPITNIPPTSGQITLTMAELNNLIVTGQNPVTANITINDNAGSNGFPVDGESTEEFTLIVNDPVFLEPIPASIAVEDNLFTLDILPFVTNYIGSLSFVPNLSFVSIDSSGVISFTPTHNDILNASGQEEDSTFIVNVNVSDEYDSSASREWSLTVNRINDIPICDPIDDQAAVSGTTFMFNYSANASDEEGIVTFSDNIGFFDINETTGLIEVLVNESMVGIHNVIITVTDSDGSQCTSQFQLTLIGNNPPKFPRNRSLDVYPNEDLYVDSDFPDLNFPDSEFMLLSGGNPIRRGYLQFNLLDVGHPAAVISAFLNLTIYNASNLFDVSIHNLSIDNFSFINLTYNNLGSISSDGVTIPTSGISNNVDVFDLTSIVNEWFNDTTLDRYLIVNLTDESLQENISYYSIDFPSQTRWPILSLSYLLNISDYNWTSGSSLINVFDLDDFFYDTDGDILTYSVNSSENIIVNIDAFNQVSLGNIAGFSGEEIVTFIATDGFANISSNLVKLTVEEPPTFEVQTTTQVESSSSSSKTVTKKKVASIGIIFDTLRKTIEKGKKIDIPVKIKNTGEIPLSGIDLSLIIDKTDLKGTLTLDHISSLGIGTEESLKMIIDTENTKESRYVISLNAKSSDIEESNVFILDVIQETGATIKQIEVAKRLFEDNPECLEFQEIVQKAEEQILSNQIAQAQVNIESAIEGCKSIIRKEEEPGLIKKNYENLVIILLSIIVGTLFLFAIYLLYRRIRYHFSEEDEE